MWKFFRKRIIRLKILPRVRYCKKVEKLWLRVIIVFPDRSWSRRGAARAKLDIPDRERERELPPSPSPSASAGPAPGPAPAPALRAPPSPSPSAPAGAPGTETPAKPKYEILNNLSHILVFQTKNEITNTQLILQSVKIYLKLRFYIIRYQFQINIENLKAHIV